MARDQHTEYGIEELRKEMYALNLERQNDIKTLSSGLTSLQTTVQTDSAVFNEIANLLNNSHPEWSHLAYTTAGVTPSDAGDTNLEAYNWYRELYSETDLTVDANNPLKAEKTSEPADHSLWAANEAVDADIPRWDKVNGRIEIGGVTNRWDLFVPVPNDIIFPGNIFYIQFEAMLRSSTQMPSGLQAYCGFWDSTLGERKWIEGGAFTITGSIYGIPGGKTISYQVLARTDSGEEAISNLLTFTDAPSVFSQNNHPRINFSGVAGFIEFEIYRQDGSEVVLQYVVRNAIEGTYYDIGNPPIRNVAALPTVTTTKPKAYAQTTTFQPGSLNGTSFVRQDMTVFIPTTYDRSLTGPGQQFFRFGLTAPTAEARQIYVRRFGVSQGYGLWSRSANDVRPGAHSSPSSTATGSPGGTGGIEPEPPSPGGGGGACVLLSTPIRTAVNGEVSLGTLPRGELLDSGGAVYGRNLYVKRGYASRIYWVKTANGCEKGCTWDHPLITSPTDYFGTAAHHLKMKLQEGKTVTILTKPDDVIEASEIVSMEAEYGDFAVGIPIMEGSHICITGNILDHNEKPEPGNEF